MPEVTKYRQGTPSWLDLNTTDQAGAETFYGKLFGWQFKREPAGEGREYSMQYLKEKAVAGIMEQSDEEKARGVPSAWYTYITVDNADAVTGKVKELGGQIFAEPFDALEYGRMAMLQDPEGAIFCIWQPVKHIGAELVNEPGALIWNELAVNDPETVSRFYAALFDIGIEDMEGMPEYKLFHIDGKNVAGIMKKPGEIKDSPSFWSIYFAVENTDQIVQKTRSLGGGVMGSAIDTPMGRVAVLKDPQGASFQVISYTDDQA